MIYNTNKFNKYKFYFSVSHFMGVWQRVIFIPVMPFSVLYHVESYIAIFILNLVHLVSSIKDKAKTIETRATGPFD